MLAVSACILRKPLYAKRTKSESLQSCSVNWRLDGGKQRFPLSELASRKFDRVVVWREFKGGLVGCFAVPPPVSSLVFGACRIELKVESGRTFSWSGRQESVNVVDAALSERRCLAASAIGARVVPADQQKCIGKFHVLQNSFPSFKDTSVVVARVWTQVFQLFSCLQ